MIADYRKNVKFFVELEITFLLLYLPIRTQLSGITTERGAKMADKATAKGGLQELELDADNVLAFMDMNGLLHFIVNPNENSGRTKGGAGNNLSCGCTHGYRPVVGAGLKGYKVNVHLIKKP